MRYRNDIAPWAQDEALAAGVVIDDSMEDSDIREATQQALKGVDR